MPDAKINLQGSSKENMNHPAYILRHLPAVVVASEALEDEFDNGEYNLKEEFLASCDCGEIEPESEFTSYAEDIIKKGFDSDDENLLGALTLLLYAEDMDYLMDHGMERESELKFSVGDTVLFEGTYENLVAEYSQYLFN